MRPSFTFATNGDGPIRHVGAVSDPAVIGARFFIDGTNAKGYVVVTVRCPEDAVARRSTNCRKVVPSRATIGPPEHERDRPRRYNHAALASEPLLALPDVVASCLLVRNH